MIPFIIAYLCLLLYLPKISDNPIIQLLPIIGLVICIVYYNYKGNISIVTYRKFGNTCIILILIVLAGLFRTNKPNVSLLIIFAKAAQFILFIIALFSVLLFYAKKQRYFPKDFIFKTTIVPFSLYCGINIVSWAIGIKPSSYEELEIGNAMILSNFGIDIERVKFPFALGINSFGAVIGGIFTLCLVDIFVLKKRTYNRYIFSTILLITLLLIDSRSAIFYPIFITIFAFFIQSSSQLKIAKILPYIVLLGPLLIFVISGILATTGLGASLSRSAEDLASGNARFFMWGVCLNEISDFKIEHIFGYGDYGHYASGASSKWADIFSYHWGDSSEWAHPHNTALINLFDYGYFGLIIYIAFLVIIVKNIRNIWNIDRYNATLLLAFLCYVVMVGVTEASFGFYYINSIYLFFSVFCISFYFQLGVKYSIKKKDVEEILNEEENGRINSTLSLGKKTLVKS